MNGMIDPKNDFDRKFQSITGLNFSVTDLIEKATDDKAKAELYYKLSWKVAKGVYLANPEVDLFQLFNEVITGLQEKLNISGSADDVDNDGDVDLDDAKVNKETQFIEDVKNSTIDVEETSDDTSDDTSEDEETYTAEEAAAYNLTLDGALQYGAIKVANPEKNSYSYDYIHDESSWNSSFTNGGLKLYYAWSDDVNSPYKEDLWNTVENRAANINDAKKVNDEYVLDENGNYIYENCERCWQGAINAPGAKYPWIVPYFDTDVNATIKFQYEGKEDVTPWGDKVFGIGKKENGDDRLFGCASIPNELGEEFLLDSNGNTTFNIAKFNMVLIKQDPELYTDEEVDEFNATLDGAKKAGDKK